MTPKRVENFFSFRRTTFWAPPLHLAFFLAFFLGLPGPLSPQAVVGKAVEPENAASGDAVLVVSHTVDAEGGILDLHRPLPQLRWFRLVIEPGTFTRETEIRIFLSHRPREQPLGFKAVSPLIELHPRGLELPRDIIVLLPYEDEDQDGIIDGTQISEKEIHPAYYSEENRCWGPLEPLVPDHGANMIGFKTNHLDPIMLWAAENRGQPPKSTPEDPDQG